MKELQIDDMDRFFADQWQEQVDEIERDFANREMPECVAVQLTEARAKAAAFRDRIVGAASLA